MSPLGDHRQHLNPVLFFILHKITFSKTHRYSFNKQYGISRTITELLHNYSSDKFERIELTEEAIKLANAYVKKGVVGKTSLEDCRHIALATINRVDVLASWNFKHIVNLDKIKGYNSVNLLLGYQMIEIRSPKDLINYGND